jgi:glycosyltransferase involved in cell wall biosynthesis
MSRVLQVALSLHPGGTERLIVDHASRLHDELPTAVCCLDVKGAWAADLEQRGIRVVALGRTPGFHPSLGRAVARVAREHRADVLHAHHYSPFVYSCLARLSYPPGRVVFTEHGRLSDTGPSSKRRVANRLLAPFAHAVCAVSHDVREHIVAEGFAASKVAVIYNGIDIGPAPDATARARIRTALRVDDETVVVGTIARLDPVKDIGTLIGAAAIASRTARICLLIVGDGAERRDLESAASAASEGGQLDVRFMGHLDDARRWLAGCDIYANNSITEGISLTILEAMAAGLPVVATRVGGTPEVVDDSCGFLVPPRQPAGLADAIVKLIEHPQLRASLGAAARRRAEHRFALDRMVDEYRTVYNRVGDVR